MVSRAHTPPRGVAPAPRRGGRQKLPVFSGPGLAMPWPRPPARAGKPRAGRGRGVLAGERPHPDAGRPGEANMLGMLFLGFVMGTASALFLCEVWFSARGGRPD